MKRFVITSIVVGILLVIAGYRLLGRDDAALVYRLEQVQSGALVSTVSASGTLKPETSAFVSPETAGQVKEVLAGVNDEVKAGQVLARLNPDVAQVRLDTAQAELAVAQQAIEVARRQVDRAQYEADNAQALQASIEAEATRAEVTVVDAGRDLKRKRRLMATDDVAPVDAEHSKTAYDSASAGVASAQARAAAAVDAFAAAQGGTSIAQAQLKSTEATVAIREAAVRQAQLDLDHTLLRAPTDGVVVERHVVVGQSVGVAVTTPPLFVIAGDLRHLRLHVRVAEADIGRVAVGQSVTFVFDAFLTEVFSGQVTAIWPQPESAQSVVAYEVLISIDNADRKLLPGMTADVHITVGRVDDVLKVPNAALRFKPANAQSAMTKTAGGDGEQTRGGAQVWRLGRNGQPYAISVRTGISDGVFTEVETVDGALAKGDDVVVAATQPTSGNARVGPLKF